MKGKKANIAVTVFVVLSVVLLGWVLFVFISNTDKVSFEITNSKALESLYFVENTLEFQVINMMKRAMKTSSSESSFIENLKKEFEKSENSLSYFDDNLKQIKEQITSENIGFDNKIARFKFKVKLEEKWYNGQISYLWDKELVVEV